MMGKASKCDPGIPDGVSLSLLLCFHFSSCWLWHGPALALGAIWRMDQWMESSLSPTSLSISLCNSVKESDLRNNSNGDMIRCSSPRLATVWVMCHPFCAGLVLSFPCSAWRCIGMECGRNTGPCVGEGQMGVCVDWRKQPS